MGAQAAAAQGSVSHKKGRGPDARHSRDRKHGAGETRAQRPRGLCFPSYDVLRAVTPQTEDRAALAGHAPLGETECVRCHWAESCTVLSSPSLKNDVCPKN